MKKLIIRLFIALIVVIVIAIFAAGPLLDKAIKKGVETFGPKLTKVDIKLESVSLSLFSGSGAIQGLVVGNPEGYKTPSAISVGETLLHQLTDAKAVGRLVIDLKAVLRTKPGSSDDVILRNGDELIVPKQRQEVMVLGEVQDPTSHLYKRRMTRDDYIDQSGGPTRQADRRHIYVVRADGSVDSGSKGWFHGGDSVDMRAGDAIVVPLNTERLPALTVWSAVTQILYNLAIAAAEVHATIP